MAKPKVREQEEVAAILSVLDKYPDGASPKQILDESGLLIRTFQRRIKLLLQRGDVLATGKSNARRYQRSNNEEDIIPTETASQKKATETKTGTILLSDEGSQVLAQVRMPLAARNPIGYKRAFLDAYTPNITYYLSAKTRGYLALTGKTTNADEPAGTYARQILNRLLIDLSWNSSRLEGNTYSLLDTRRLIEQNTIPEEKSASETQMILNHKDAIEFLVQSDTGIGLNRYTIMGLHAMLSNNLLPDPSATGRLRKYGVGISQSAYTPLDVPQQIEEMFDLLLGKASQITDPFEQAFFVMVHLPYLQAFDDVNKRVSRLAANIPLIRHNLAPLSFTDVPQDLYISGLLAVYEFNNISLLRDVFIGAYERSAARYANLRQALGEPDPFRLQYREKIKEVVRHVIINELGPAKASNFIKNAAVELPSKDQANFLIAAETELESLHEGNFARYWVSPLQFQKWRGVWSVGLQE